MVRELNIRIVYHQRTLVNFRLRFQKRLIEIWITVHVIIMINNIINYRVRSATAAFLTES